MSATIEVSTLDSLRDTANREHQLVVLAARDLLDHAIAAGHALNEAREIIPYGKWMDWVEREFTGSVSNANFYRRLALNAEVVTASGVRTLREAERFMTDHAQLTTPTPRTGSLVKQRRQEILRLRQVGKDAKEIADLVGISRSTVYNLARKDWQRINRRRNVRKKQALQALQRQERDRAAKQVGGDIGEAYALTRRTAQTIEKAIEAATNKQTRQHLSRALDRLYRCEDEISRAIRTAK